MTFVEVLSGTMENVHWGIEWWWRKTEVCQKIFEKLKKIPFEPFSLMSWFENFLSLISMPFRIFCHHQQRLENLLDYVFIRQTTMIRNQLLTLQFRKAPLQTLPTHNLNSEAPCFAKTSSSTDVIPKNPFNLIFAYLPNLIGRQSQDSNTTVIGFVPLQLVITPHQTKPDVRLHNLIFFILERKQFRCELKILEKISFLHSRRW